MWVYWITLGSLSIILYFPFKKLFPKEVAARASVATFVLGLFYPLLQARLSFWQTLVSLGLLLLFLGITITRKHPQWDSTEEEHEESLPEQIGFIQELKQEDRAAVQSKPSENLITAQEISGEKEFEIQDILIPDNSSYNKLSEELTSSDQRFNKEVINYAEPVEETFTTKETIFTEQEEFKSISLETQSEDVLLPEEQDPLSKTIGDSTADVDVFESQDELYELTAEEKQVEHSIQEDTYISLVASADEEIFEFEASLNNTDDVVSFGDVIKSDSKQIDTDVVDTLGEGEIPQYLAQEYPIEIAIQTDPALPVTVPADNSNNLVEKQAVTVEDNEPEPKTIVTSQSLLSEGLRLSKNREYAQAVRYFNQVISHNPEQEILYLVVSELSSIYQHLGLYPMASEIIKAFVDHPSLKNHAGLEHLIQKMKFIECLTDLLQRDHYGQIPYEEVPEAVRREAFDNSLNIKRLIS